MALPWFGREMKKGSAEMLILSLIEHRPRHGDELSKLTVCLGIGAGLAWMAARAARSLLFGVQGAQPGLMVAAIAGLALAGLAAALLPALRATRLNPMQVLREE